MQYRWYDVEDEEGVWRLGHCYHEDKEGLKSVSLDGFHPNFNAFYCKHTSKLLEVRTKTKGLTCPTQRKPIRPVLASEEVQNISGRLTLFLNHPNLLDLEPKKIRTILRTQFLVMTDRIICTPYEIIKQKKLLQLHINNLFINLLDLYLKIIEYSKIYLPLIQSNPSAKQIYNSVYEMTIMANLIMGNHHHSSLLYSHQFNITLKSQGFIDYFIQSEWLLPFRQFFKKINTIPKLTMSDFEITIQLIRLFISLWEKGQFHLKEQQNQTKLSLVLDEIIKHLKNVSESSPQALSFLKNQNTFVAKIQTLYSSLKNNKTCPLRSYLLPKEQKQKKPKKKEQIEESKIEIHHEEKIKQLEERIKKLQTLATHKQEKIPIPNEDQVQAFQKNSNIPTQNLGEEMFLSSLEWALETGELQTARKLTKWRRSLLQVGRITGWEVALSIGAKTFKKAEITPTDIIEANYEYLSRHNC